MTSSVKISSAAAMVASCNSSLAPKRANTPLLLIANSPASRPMDNASSPSTDAIPTACANTAARVCAPRSTRPSVTATK
jgi:hypothetical protein